MSYLDAAGTGDQEGQFDYRFFNDFSWFRNAFGATLRWRHYPSIDHASIVQNPATTTQGAEAYDIFDLSGRYAINDQYELRFGIDNLLDEDPELEQWPELRARVQQYVDAVHFE